MSTARSWSNGPFRGSPPGSPVDQSGQAPALQQQAPGSTTAHAGKCCPYFSGSSMCSSAPVHSSTLVPGPRVAPTRAISASKSATVMSWPERPRDVRQALVVQQRLDGQFRETRRRARCCWTPRRSWLECGHRRRTPAGPRLPRQAEVDGTTSWGGAAATQPTLTTTIDAANTTKPASPTWRAVKHRGTSSPWNDRPEPTAAAHRRPRRRRGVQRRATPDSPVGMGRSGMDRVVARVARQVRWGQGEAGQAEGRVS